MTEPTLQSSNVTSNGSLNSPMVNYNLRLALSLPSQLFCLLGLAGNAVVIWFLWFGIKRNSITVYILNLAVVDFSLLLCISIDLVYILVKTAGVGIPWAIMVIRICIRTISIFGINLSLYLLTAISVERCLSVMHPIWYKCSRPKNLSAIMCVILWVFAMLSTTVESLPCTGAQCTGINIFLLCLGFGIITPLMIVSSLLLALCVQRNSQKRQPMRLYWAVLLNVLVFLITSFPTRLVFVFDYFQVITLKTTDNFFLLYSHIFLATVNSSANPFIYFLVGKTNKIKSRQFLKVALLRVFRSDHDMSSRDETSTSSLSRTRESIISKYENSHTIH